MMELPSPLWLVAGGVVLYLATRKKKAPGPEGGIYGDYRTWTLSNVDSAVRTTVLAAGYPETVYQGLRANYIAESNGDPYAVGDGGNAVGLYQISYADPPIDGQGLLPILAPDSSRANEHIGWQYGLPNPLDPRVDPVKATQIMLAAIAANTTVSAMINAGQPAELIAYYICVEIERPDDRYTKAQERADLVTEWYG